MEKRLGTVTLGVRDLARARRFYEEGLGWTRDGGEADIAFYQLGGLVLGLYQHAKLARDAKMDGDAQGFRAISLGYCTRSRNEVEQVLAAAARAGATVKVEAHDTFWGGYGGYFVDLDGHLWEVAFNPHLELTERGEHRMKPRH